MSESKHCTICNSKQHTRYQCNSLKLIQRVLQSTDDELSDTLKSLRLANETAEKLEMERDKYHKEIVTWKNSAEYHARVVNALITMWERLEGRALRAGGTT